MGGQWPAAVLGALSVAVHAWDHLKEVTIIFIASTRESWILTESLGQSLVGSLLLSPGSWCTQDFVCTLQESVSLV